MRSLWFIHYRGRYELHWFHHNIVLESLHWLPLKYQILFKFLLLTYKCLNGLGPGYLSCLVMPRKHRYEPRPQHQGQLQVPEARLKSYGERSFGFSASTEWNKLPIDVKSALTLASFKVKLKTHLYKICYKMTIDSLFCFSSCSVCNYDVNDRYLNIYLNIYF